MGQQKRGNFSKSERKWDLEYFCRVGMILRLIEFGIVLEYFCRIEVGLRIFLPEERREERFGLRNILSKKAKGRKGVGLRIICPSKREKKSKVKQVRRGVPSVKRERIMIESVSQIDSKITTCAISCKQ